MKVISKHLPDPLETIMNLPSWMTTVPLTAFSPQYSPEEKVLQAIARGLTPSQMRKELGKHVERLVDSLTSERLIVFDGQRQIGGHWRNAYKLTRKGMEYTTKSWIRENLLI